MAVDFYSYSGGEYVYAGRVEDGEVVDDPRGGLEDIIEDDFLKDKSSEEDYEGYLLRRFDGPYFVATIAREEGDPDSWEVAWDEKGNLIPRPWKFEGEGPPSDYPESADQTIGTDFTETDSHSPDADIYPEDEVLSENPYPEEPLGKFCSYGRPSVGMAIYERDDGKVETEWSIYTGMRSGRLRQVGGDSGSDTRYVVSEDGVKHALTFVGRVGDWAEFDDLH